MMPLLLALDWYVADAEQADALQAALDQHWPSSGVEVHLGPVPQGAEGVWVDQGTLHWQQGARSVEQASPTSPAGQVLLVRSWTHALDPVDQGWLPAPEPLPPETPATPPAETSAAQVTPQPEAPELSRMLAAHTGVNLRNGKYNEPFRLGLELATTGRVHKALVVDVDVGARLTETDWFTSRAGGDLQLGLSREGPTGTGEVWLGAGLRGLQVHSPTEGVQYRAPLPRASLRLRWWGPGRDQSLLLGVALALQVEGTYEGRLVPTPGHPDGESWALDPATAVLEFHLGRRA